MVVQIRIEGLPKDVRVAQDYLSKCCEVITASEKHYRNRAPSKSVRAYMTVNIPGQSTDGITAGELETAYTKSKEEDLI
ncbi:MAG: hypothetical protein IKB30_02320 [Clostridia bacterium]|nr:hypothetical protein [Clostridia bacterium]